MHYISLALLFIVACSGSQVAVQPEPASTEGPATCATMCARLASLGCEGAGATQEGASCEAVCLNVQSSGVIAWDLECRSKAQSCAALDSCEDRDE